MFVKCTVESVYSESVYSEFVQSRSSSRLDIQYRGVRQQKQSRSSRRQIVSSQLEQRQQQSRDRSRDRSRVVSRVEIEQIDCGLMLVQSLYIVRRIQSCIQSCISEQQSVLARIQRECEQIVVRQQLDSRQQLVSRSSQLDSRSRQIVVDSSSVEQKIEEVEEVEDRSRRQIVVSMYTYQYVYLLVCLIDRMFECLNV